MTLAKLFSSVSWPQLEAALLFLRPDAEPALHEFQKALGRMDALEPVAQKMRISIEKRCVSDDDDGDGYYVAGRDGTLERGLDGVQEQEVVYVLWLTPWVKWLGMEISDETIGAFSPAEIAARCLLEMTSNGFGESDTQEFVAELSQQAAEMDATPEEDRATWVLPPKKS